MYDLLFFNSSSLYSQLQVKHNCSNMHLNREILAQINVTFTNRVTSTQLQKKKKQ